ncbi:MAG: peptidoglycan-binding protein [Bacillota bacterium]|nr:peptidoglycan-binding protein [Bacillota bacterium]
MKHFRLTKFAAILLSLLLLLSFNAKAYSPDTLYLGQRGELVRAMQSGLNSIGFKVVADGVFGKKTESAVIAFQRQQKLTVDGLAGKKTLELLYQLAPQFKPAGVNAPSEIVPPTTTKIDSNDSITKPSGTMYVYTANKGSLNLRNRPSSGKTTIAQIPYGTSVSVLSSGNGWTKISVNGRTGYVVSSFLKPELKESASAPSAEEKTSTPNKGSLPNKGKQAQVITANRGSLNLRSRASYSGTVLIQIPHAASVQVYSSKGSWSKVGYNNYTGYVVSSFLKMSSAAAQKPAPADAVKPDETKQDQAQEEPQEEKIFSRVLKSGMKGADVKELQTRLAGLKYKLTINSVYDEKTREAVTSFQKQNYLKADGIFGSASAALLLSGSARSATEPKLSYTTLRIDNKGDKVTQMQKALKALKYPLSVNGSYDVPTHQSVVAFQQRNGLAITGVADPMTQSAIFSAKAKDYSTPAKGIGASEGKGGGPSKGQVKLLHWFNDVKKSASAGQTATVYHPGSDSSFKVRFYSMGHHADSEPSTWKDTQIMNRAFGTPSWNINTVYVKLPDGRWTLASMHNRPHLTGAVSANGFGGHLCIHFLRDTDEVNRNDPRYGANNQRAIRKAWLALTGETVD